MLLRTLLIVFFIMILIGALPRWRYSRGWGYAPTGVLGSVLVVLVVLLLLGLI